MPPKGEKLTRREIADLEEWVKMGAPDPRDGRAGRRRKLTRPDRQGAGTLGVPAGEEAGGPGGARTAWVKTPVDAFILQKLEGKRHDAVAAGEQGSADPPRHATT